MLINTYIILIILHKEFQLSENRDNFKTLLCKVKGKFPLHHERGVPPWRKHRDEQILTSIDVDGYPASDMQGATFCCQRGRAMNPHCTAENVNNKIVHCILLFDSGGWKGLKIKGPWPSVTHIMN
jgi:hypothetical protein